MHPDGEMTNGQERLWITGHRCRYQIIQAIFLHCMAVKILGNLAQWLPSLLIVRQTDAIQSKWSGYANGVLLLLL